MNFLSSIDFIARMSCLLSQRMQLIADHFFWLSKHISMGLSYWLENSWPPWAPRISCWAIKVVSWPTISDPRIQNLLELSFSEEFLRWLQSKAWGPNSLCSQSCSSQEFFRWLLPISALCLWLRWWSCESQPAISIFRVTQSLSFLPWLVALGPLFQAHWCMSSIWIKLSQVVIFYAISRGRLIIAEFRCALTEAVSTNVHIYYNCVSSSLQQLDDHRCCYSIT